MYSFGIRGKQFQYVEGKLPEGFPFHGRMTDHDVRNLQARGAEVIVVEAHYTAEDLKQARADCRGETGTTPNQSEAKAAVVGSAADPGSGKEPQTASAAPTPPPVTAATGKVSITSIPDAADVEVDGSFVGNAPADIQLPDGDHVITVKKSGFADWQRKMKLTAGSSVHLQADLERSAGQ